MLKRYTLFDFDFTLTKFTKYIEGKRHKISQNKLECNKTICRIRL